MAVLNIKSSCLLCQRSVTYGGNKIHLTPVFLYFIALTGHHDWRWYCEWCRRCPAVRYESSASADREVQVSVRSTPCAPERGEVTVGNDFCIYLSAKWHCTLIFLQHINFWKKRSYSLEPGTRSKRMHKTRFFPCLFQIFFRWWHKFAVSVHLHLLSEQTPPCTAVRLGWMMTFSFAKHNFGKHCVYESGRKGKTCCLWSFKEIFSVKLLL